MAKILTQYIALQSELESQINANSLPPDSLVKYQELTYRIAVLNTCKVLCKTAPLSTDMQAMGYHYHLTDMIFAALLTERKFGLKVDEDGKKKRETAHVAVERAIEDGRRRFRKFTATTQEQYKNIIVTFINAVVPLWLQYRNTYINI